MGFKPNGALVLLRKMGSTPQIHFGELSLRFLVGLGIYRFSEQTPHIRAFQIAGVFLMVTSIIIMCVPHKFHHAYARWWAEKIPPLAVRFLGLVPVIFGVWLFHIIRAA